MTGLILLILAQERVEDLVGQLRSEEIERRDHAATRLKAMGKAALPALEKAAADADAEFAGRAKSIVEYITLEASLPARLKKAIPGVTDRLVGTADQAWAAVFLEAARREGPERLPKCDLEPLAARAVRGAGEPEMLGEILQFVGKRRLRSAAKSVQACLDNEDDYARAYAAEALGQIGTTGCAPALIKLLLKDEFPDARAAAATALGVLGVAEAAAHVRALTADAESGVRRQAYEALGKLKDSESLEILRKAIKDETGLERIGALRALTAIAPPEALPHAVRLLEEGDMPNRMYGFDLLLRLRLPQSEPLLRPLLKHKDADVRGLTAQCLAQTGAVAAAADIARLLEDAEPDVRSDAASALAMLGAREFLPQVTALLRQPFVTEDRLLPAWFDELAESGCHLGAKEAAAALLLAAEQKQGRILIALNGVRAPDAWEKLRRTLIGKPVAGTCAQVLAEIGRAAGLPFDTGAADAAWLEDENEHLSKSAGGDSVRVTLNVLTYVSAYDVIVEPDRLRLVTREEALRFWKEWVEKNR